MPHFIIEHTDNARPTAGWNDIFDALFTEAAMHPTMNRKDMKGRVRNLAAAYVSDGDAAKSYVHLEVALLSGRPPEVIEGLGKSLLTLLQGFFEKTAECQYSVELRDMNKPSYFKETV